MARQTALLRWTSPRAPWLLEFRATGLVLLDQATGILFLASYIVHPLSDARDGIWALVTRFTCYDGLPDTRFLKRITQQLARFGRL